MNEIEDVFEAVFDWLPDDPAEPEGTGEWIPGTKAPVRFDEALDSFAELLDLIAPQGVGRR